MDQSRKQRAAISGLAAAAISNKVVGRNLTESAFLGLGVSMIVYVVWDTSIHLAPETNITLMPVEREKNYM
jgi:hypothetical protein